jgi:hypothetical protein
MIGNKIYEDTFFNLEGTKGHAPGKGERQLGATCNFEQLARAWLLTIKHVKRRLHITDSPMTTRLGGNQPTGKKFSAIFFWLRNQFQEEPGPYA